MMVYAHFAPSHFAPSHFAPCFALLDIGFSEKLERHERVIGDLNNRVSELEVNKDAVDTALSDITEKDIPDIEKRQDKTELYLIKLIRPMGKKVECNY
jgi:hypothetical protein